MALGGANPVLRVRQTVNGTEVFDPLTHKWYPMDRGEAQKLVSNALFPKGYRNGNGKHKPTPKSRVSTLSGVELRAGKGGQNGR